MGDQNRSQTFERTDIETRFKELHNSLREAEQNKLEHVERLDLLHKRVESIEQAHEDLQSNVRRMQFTPQDAVATYQAESTLQDRELAFAPSDSAAATIELHMR